jgi:uncharacterized protein (TIGR03083 family)
MSGPRTWIAALRGSHDRLESLITPLNPAQLAAPSYCNEWSIAQVLSHLGSGAEIFSLFLDAGLAGAAAPGRESFQPIWADWNARSPREQAAGWRSSDATFVERLESLDDEQLARLQLDLFGMKLDAAGLARIRLSEHLVHTWDVAVALDPAARLASDGVELLAGNLGLGQRLGKPQGEHLRVAVHTTYPQRDLSLSVGEAVGLAEGTDQPADAGQAASPGQPAYGELRLPCEAFIRLMYGRLDPGHTPADVTADGVSLDTLRAVFPGI